MPMTRAQMDEFDRIMMGQPAQQPMSPPVAYTPQPSPPMTDVEGRPITRSYSLDDIRRFLGLGGGSAPAPLGGMPVEAQADQIMRSVSRVNPQSFGQRYRQQMR